MNGDTIRMRETPVLLNSGSRPAPIESSTVRTAFSHKLNSADHNTIIEAK